MLNWNTISSWTTKAGDISSKVKGFAKDLMTVDEEPLQNSNEKSQSPRSNPDVSNFNQDSPSNQYAQELKSLLASQEKQREEELKPTIPQENLNPKEQIPFLLMQIQNICKQELLKTGDYSNFSNFLKEQFDSLIQTENNQQLNNFEFVRNIIEEQAIKNFNYINATHSQSITLIDDILKQLQIEFSNFCQVNQQEQSELKQHTNDQKLLSNYKICLTELVQLLKGHIRIFYQKQPFDLEFNDDLKSLNTVINKLLLQCQQIHISVTKSISSKHQENYQKLSENHSKLQEIHSQLIKREQQLQSENFLFQKKFVDVQDKLTGFQMESITKEKRIKELEKYIGDWDKNKREFLEELKQKNQENELLRAKIKQREYDLSQLQLTMKEIGSELKQMHEIRQELEQKEDECNQLNSQLEEQFIENQSLQQASNNRDKLHEQEIIKLNDLIKKYEQEIKKLLSEIEQQQINKNEKDEQQELLEKLRKQDQLQQRMINDLEGKLQIINQEKQELGIEIALLQKKLKNDQIYQNNLVDRRVISRFLVNYFDVNTQYLVKMQILETLSSILAFSEEDREKIGFFKNNKQISDKQSNSPKVQSPTSSFKDKFIGFLMNDDE